MLYCANYGKNDIDARKCCYWLCAFLYHGGLAQMVERALCMREVVGSMPASSTKNYIPSLYFFT